jgi:hypothetical protein
VTVIINRGESYPRQWLRQFNARLDKWPGAKEALERLERAGCDREVLLRDLHKYVVSSQTLEPRRVAYRRACRKIEKCLRQLERASASFVSFKLDLGVPFSTIHQQHQLESLLAEHQQTLSDLKKEYTKRGSAKGAGRDEESLVTLAMVIEGRSGAKHRRELALLLEVAAEADGKKLPMDEDMMRKIFLRFRNLYPVMYRGIQEFYAPHSRQAE